MNVSGRNQIRGKVTYIKQDAIMAEVTITLPGGQEITSVITTSSLERLGIALEKEVVAVVKSTDVLLAVDHE